MVETVGLTTMTTQDPAGMGQARNGTGTLDTRKTLHILGLFALNGSLPEGLTFLPAALLAMENINTNYSDLLPGYKLQINAYNTECEEAIALNNFYQEIYNENRTTIMVLGATCSTPTEVTAQVSHLWGLQQISYAAVSPYLSNKRKFPSFFRVMTPQQNLTVARVRLFQEFGWRRVHTVYQNQIIFSTLDDIMKQDLAREGFDVVSTEMFTDDPVNIEQNLRKNDARIIIGNMYEEKTRQLLCYIYQQVPDVERSGAWYTKLVWVLPSVYLMHWMDETDVDVNCTTDQVREVLGNYFAIGSREYVTDRNYTADANVVPSEFYTLMNGRSLCDSVWNLIPSEFKSFFNYNSFYADESLKGQHRAPEAYDAVWAIAVALNLTISYLRMNGDQKRLEDFTYKDTFFSRLLHESMQNVSFKSLNGPFKFNTNGERLPGISITQYIRKRGTFTEVGYCDYADSTFEWQCSLNRSSVVWEKGVSPVDGIQQQARLTQISLYYRYTFWTLSCVGVTVTLVLLVFNIGKRKHRLIKMSSPNLNNVILCGCLLAYCSVFIIDLVTEGGQVTCMVHTITLVLSFSLCFGALFAKTWRVYEIFTAGVKVLNTKMLKDTSLFLIVSALVIVNTVILVVWEVAFPQAPTLFNISTTPSTTNRDIEYVNQYQRCDSRYRLHFMSALFTIQGVVILFGTFLAVQTRKVTCPELNDSKWIALCIYNVVVLGPIGVVVIMATEDKPEMNYALEATMIILITSITECLIFVPKIVAYRRKSFHRRSPMSNVRLRIARTSLTGGSFHSRWSRKRRLESSSSCEASQQTDGPVRLSVTSLTDFATGGTLTSDLSSLVSNEMTFLRSSVRQHFAACGDFCCKKNDAGQIDRQRLARGRYRLPRSLSDSIISLQSASDWS
ncbi:hypothetical protein Btru_049496 [Bulinus truncatus]|nr:hypothetical protein Btru_049496 [Bulinus truncatus]